MKKLELNLVRFGILPIFWGLFTRITRNDVTQWCWVKTECIIEFYVVILTQLKILFEIACIIVMY